MTGTAGECKITALDFNISKLDKRAERLYSGEKMPYGESLGHQ